MTNKLILPTRRHVLAGLGGAAVMTLAAPSIVRAQSRSLVVASGGGSYEEAFRKAVIEPFQKETGIGVTYVSPADEAMMRAQVSSGNVEWDLAEITTPPFRPDAADYVEEIDYDHFDSATLDGLLPEAKQKYGVGSYAFSTVMSFSTFEYPADKARPDSWEEFWDADTFPGPRSLRASAAGDPTTIEFALLAAGVAKEDLYPIDFDKAFNSLNTIKPHISKFWSVGAEPGQMLSDRQVSMSSAFNGRVHLLREQGAGIDYTWSGGEISPNYWVVPKGARRREEAMKFAAYSSTAEAQARLNSILFYGPLNSAAIDLMGADAASALPTAPQNLDKQFFRDLQFWAAMTDSGKTNSEILIDRWLAWVAS